MKIQCVSCKKIVEVPILQEQYDIWQNSDHCILVQHMFPALTADEREMLLSQICGTCYDEMCEMMEHEAEVFEPMPDELVAKMAEEHLKD